VARLATVPALISLLRTGGSTPPLRAIRITSLNSQFTTLKFCTVKLIHSGESTFRSFELDKSEATFHNDLMNDITATCEELFDILTA